MRRSVRSRALTTAVIATLAGGSIASAVPNASTSYIVDGTGSWSDPANWTEGVPDLSDHARLIANATVNIDGAAQASQVQVALTQGSNTTLNINPGASLVTANDMTLGGTAQATASTATGTLNMNGGDLTILGQDNPLWVGFGGNGALNMSGGTLRVSGPAVVATGNLGLAIGAGVGKTGSLNMSGGTMYVDTHVQIARGGSIATANITGGTINIGLDLNIGDVNLTPGGGQATINHSGGTVHAGYNAYGGSNYGNFVIGVNNPASQRTTYTLSGTGVIKTQGAFEVGGGYGGVLTGTGRGGHADFIMNGGTLEIGGLTQGVPGAAFNTGGSFNIGWARGATLASDGTATINAGTVIMNVPNTYIAVGDANGIGTNPIPAGQRGVLTINGGELLTDNVTLHIGRDGATGTFNLAGGHVALGALQWKNTNARTRQFNWTGGTLDLNSADSDYAITNAGGTLRPGGTKVHTFTTAGTNGSYVQNSGALELNLDSVASYDALDLTGGDVGAATLNGGAVNVVTSTGGGFVPNFGVSVLPIHAKTITDTATWNLPTLPAGLQWDRRISADGANQSETLTIVRSAASTHAGGANWTAAAWSAGVPNAVDASAKLAGAGGTITVNAPVTVGYLQLDGTGSWTVNGGNILTFGTSSGPGGIVAFGPAHTISAPVNFAGGGGVIATQLKSTLLTLGDVGGTGTIEKTGPGTLALTSTASPFSGTWRVSGGSLKIDSDANLGAAGASLVLNNGTINTTGAWNSPRNIGLAAGATGTINVGADSTLTGVIGGAGGLTKAGSSTLTLTGPNTYTGATTVAGGTLRQGAANTLPAASAVTVAPGATLDLGGVAGSIGSLAGVQNPASAGGAYGSVTTGGADLTLGSDNTSTTFVGFIAGGGTLRKVGIGTQTLTAPAGSQLNYVTDGPIFVDAGTLKITGIEFNKYDMPMHDITVAAGATIALGGPSAGVAGPFFKSIHGAGSLEVVGGLNLSQPSTFTGGTKFTVGTFVGLGDMGALGPAGTPIEIMGNGTVDRGVGGTLWFQVGGTFSHPVTVAAGKHLYLNSGGDAPGGNTVTLTHPISGGGEVRWAVAGGTFNLQAVNTYTGRTLINAGVTVVQHVDNAIPDEGGNSIDGTFDMNGFDSTLGDLAGGANAQIKLNGGDLTLGTTHINGVYSGVITGPGTVTKVGGGTQFFAAPAGKANTWTAPLNIQEGAVQISTNINSLPAGGAVVVDSGAALIFAATAAGSGLTAPAYPTFAGTISGGGEVMLAPANTESFALAGANTYTGGTRIASGTLVVSADNNLGAASGPIRFSTSTFLSNTTPTLKFGAAFNSTRAVTITDTTGTIDTNGFDAAVGNVTGQSITGVSGLKKNGAGTLTVNHVRAGTLNVAAGTVKVASSGGVASGTSNIPTLTLAAGTTLDLTDNKLVTNNPVGTATTVVGNTRTYDGLQGLVQSAKAGDTWSGPGLTSSKAAVEGGLTTIGIANGAQAKGGIGATETALWGGQTVTGSSILAMYTYAGDANLDGAITGDDYSAIDFGILFPGMDGYANGDFNYDGYVTGDDYSVIDLNILLQGPQIPTGGVALGEASAAGLAGVTAVPEPASLGMIGLAAAGLLGRRRRRSRA